MDYFLTVLCFALVTFNSHYALEENCGCQEIRACYKDMIDNLRDRDEAACVQDAEISSPSMMIYLHALKTYCGDLIDFEEVSKTDESKGLYEVIINTKEPPRFLAEDDEPDEDKPVIIIDAGQRAGKQPVEFALYIIQSLVACKEYERLIQAVKWVILPSTNPDGLENNRYMKRLWYKNTRPLSDNISVGVDISRNFNYKWDACPPIPKSFSPEYPGDKAGSEKETHFIKSVLKKHKHNAKAYLSLRRDGHSILYPNGYSKAKPVQDSQLGEVAGRIADKVNQKAGSVQLFVNKSIFAMDGKGYCGNSVDYAYDCGVSLAFEMRVFLGEVGDILSLFQPLPLGFEPALRSGYFSGVRELHAIVIENMAKQSDKGAKPAKRSKYVYKSRRRNIYY